MGEGFITRRGGTAVGTAAPSINFVSSTFDSITFTITNNDALTADIFWEIGDSTPDANTFSLAGGATSSNQVASGLDEEETYTIFAFANAEGKAGSQTTSQVRTTPEDTRIFTAATGGTTLEYDSGGKRFKSHTFTSDGNFVVSTVGDNIDDRNKVDFLVIAGGGCGGAGINGGNQSGGGGGAGGYRTSLGTTGGGASTQSKVTVTQSTFGIVIGAGGVGSRTAPTNGTSSTFSSVTTVGGGRGASVAISVTEDPANSGGSGGGQSALTGDPAGSGTTGEGFSGGNSSGFSGAGGGGGGASQVGGNAASTTAGNGGNGLANLLRTGLNETRAGGGGGSRNGSGGTGGGGNGATGDGGNGTVNTGSAGGGGYGTSAKGGDGGSGLVIIRYEIAPSV